MKDLNTFTIIPYKDHLIELSELRSGKIIYKDFYIDILTNEKIEQDCLSWFHSFNVSVEAYFSAPKVVHFFYEFGFLVEKISDGLISDNTILAIDLEYMYFERYYPRRVKPIKLIEVQAPQYENYKKKFDEGYSELQKGNCYQFNLTEYFEFSFQENLIPKQFIDKIWSDAKNRGAFGSATYIPILDTLFLSNSPECLFEIKNNIISSKPIKGTVPFNSNMNFKQEWKRLLSDTKNRSELYMIADLVRNDLSRIEFPRSVVKNKNVPLVVPNLLHQYAHIEVEVSQNVKVKTVVEKLFPGGSITGAPKNRVMKILRALENRERKFYCGSTLIMFDEMKVASINIRSSEINFTSKRLNYQAGGGITLRSTSDNEYEELSYKLKSFINLLTL